MADTPGTPGSSGAPDDSGAPDGAATPESPFDGLTLLRLGKLIYERDGVETAKRWHASLTPDQQLAMDAEVDQFSAYIRDIAAIVKGKVEARALAAANRRENGDWTS